MAAEAPGVHKDEGHSVGTQAETAVGWVELWKNMGRNASVNQVFENIESARRERNGTLRIKGGGVTIAGLPSGWNHSKAQDEVEEGKQKMTPPLE